MAQDGKVPVREVVGAALGFLRENAVVVAVAAGIGAGVMALLAMLAANAPAVGILIGVASSLVSAFVYAALTGAALYGAGGVAQRLFADGGRVWASMVVIGFFLLIVFIVLLIPGFILLAVFLAPRYGTELQAVSGDEAGSVALMERIATENPLMLLGFALFYGLLWLALTSRLFLAAPASIDNKRILTFETWAWTKGNMMRIIGARIMLLLPAYILVSALSYILAMALGVNMMDPANVAAFAQRNSVLYALLAFVSGFVQIGLYRALEAGLSAYLYRGLKPASAA